MAAIMGFLILIGAFFFEACAGSTSPLSLPANALPAAVRHNQEGIEQYRMGHWNSAKAHFEAAVQSTPPLAEVHYNLALALDKLGDHPAATAHFKHAGELAPRNPAITQSDIYLYHMATGPRPPIDPIHRPIMGGY
ncbi:MAG TPA: tetratricopeptide repeat protein [Nitrospiraceae bacterium]|nr:tetratricopeptide repeat protein [Nitrospiraceae bacterium]